MENAERAPTRASAIWSWVNDWGNALAVLTVMYAVGYLGWLASGAGGDVLRRVVARLAFLPINTATATLALRAAAHSVDPRIRRALRFLGAAYLCVLLGNVVSFYLGMVLDADPLVDWTNVIYLCFYPLTLLALLSLPLARRIQNEHWKFLLDAAVVLLGGGLAIWYLVLRPTALTGEQGTLAAVIALAYPLGDILLLLGITTVVLRQPFDSRRWAFRLLVGGLVVYVLSDLCNDLLLMEIGWMGIGWTDFTFMASYCLLAVGFQQYHARIGDESGRTSDEQSPVQPFSPLPYAAVCLVYGLLLDLALHHWREPLGVLAAGTVLVTALVVVRQISAVRENVRLLTDRAARETEVRFRSLVQHSSDVIAIVEADTVLRYVSPSAMRVFGYAPEELEGKRLAELLHPDDVARGLETFAAATSRPGVTAPTEWRIQNRNGVWLHVEAVGTNLMHEPTIRGLVLNTRDISERKALEAQLTHQAFHDPLTGLANRALFRDRVSHALTLVGRHRHTLSVLFLDLDNFKTVNDSLGHAAGDRLLVAAAQRLLTCVRASDTVARLGGDEFAILVEDTFDDGSSSAVVERITTALQHPFTLEGKEVFISASIGIATATNESSAADLLRNADMAMYMAKSRGKGRHEVFESRMHAEALERLELEADLRRAIDRQEFMLVYQPIVVLRTGEVTGVEALVRWHHPRRGTLSPAQFIPLAEETGLIVPLGQWVLREACRRAQMWQTRRGPDAPIAVTVNISGQQLQHASVIEDVRTALAESGLEPTRLVLEITESVLMQHTDTMLQRLRALKAVGVRLAIDDFGTGYSSLSYLQRFPIDILKIAKPFVDDVGAGGTEPALARAIIALGDTLRLETIAEGIEFPRQLSGLQALGCTMGQGFFFARPADGDAIEAMLYGERVEPGIAR